MIKYQLICDKEHEFECWFSGSSAYEDQLSKGYVDCAICGSQSVKRALMAPNLNSPKTRQNPEFPALPKSDDVGDAIATKQISPAENPLAKLSPTDQAAVMGAAMTALRDIHKKVKKDFTNVGDKFADEARKIYYGDAQTKPIYGTTTADERDDLADEGIVFHHLPDLPSEH